ncbi:MAG: tetratricopeptide repeat protein [Polyangiales bacterium]
MSIDRQKVIDAAQKYAAKNQFDRAIVEYQRVLREDPHDVRVLLKVGDLQVRMNARQAAIETYSRVAIAYDQQGFFLKAIAVYKQILQIDQSLVQLYLKLAELYVKLGLGSDAMQHLDALAQRYARAEDHESLGMVYRRMLQVDPSSVGTRIRLAELLSKLDRGDEAATEFEAACALLDHAGRPDDWARVAERLFFHRGTDVALARRLAAFYLDRSDAKRALPKLQVAYKADSRDIDTLDLLASAFRELGQLPKTVSVLKEIARIHGEAGRQKERAATYQRVLEFAPNDQEARDALRPAPRAKGLSDPPPPAAVVRAAPPVAPVSSLPPEAIVEDADDDILVVDEDVVFDLKQSGEAPLPSADPEPAPVAQPVRAPTPARGNALNPAIPGAPKMPTAIGPSVEVGSPVVEEAARHVPRATSPFSAPRPYAPQSPAAAQAAAVDRGPTTEALRLVGEAEIFIKYGLRPKALDHLSRASRLDPQSVELHERLVDLFVALAEPAALLRELLIVAQLRESASPAVALGFVVRALEIDATNATALALYERLRGPEEAPPEETAVDDVDVKQTSDDPYAETSENPPLVLPQEIYRPAPEVVELDYLGDAYPEAPAQQGGAQYLEDEVYEVSDLVTGTVEHAAAAGAPRREIEECLDETEFYVTQGLYDDALELLRLVLEQHPNHPLVLERWEEVEQLAAMQHAADPDAQPFDIGNNLAEEVESLSPAESAPAYYQVDEVANAFGQFKEGVSRTVSAEDCDTHYDLGIAYKEMGLLDDAIAEFKIATMSAARQCIGEMMIGLCFMEKGDVSSAISSFRRGLQAPQRTEHEELGLYYEMGTAYEYAGDVTEALYYLQKVEKRDPTFRNVRAHLQRLLARSVPAPPSITPALEDLDRAFDELVKE